MRSVRLQADLAKVRLKPGHAGLWGATTQMVQHVEGGDAHRASAPTHTRRVFQIPGLSLTEGASGAIMGLDAITSEALLAALIDVNFLRRTGKGAYVRDDGARDGDADEISCRPAS